ncbi:xanthine dehydrogenase family protein subunit M [Nakamurella flavida]|uniref:Xanthine dehydrogenase family protein subunit M n=1 Tax=Nakamurella flavida TaxID=363630 RepID=A0A939C1M1_9ACTN|nr:xanthine dehydrogenase family protein subunit M [Nakamurella flavida]MBM9475605.1 xanthine dehydrogenase family protein subunit M [Nakamurella flavida]MDP9778119.1 carbon-monoxide dehydrogenase medium subunit [Nakamurella flavida]
MIPTAFDYTAPTTLDEAVAALQEGGDEAKILAGGQSLVPVLRLRMADPGVLVDLRKIAELREITQDGDGVRIGAMATHHAVLSHPLVKEHVALLAETEGTVADPQVRHRGTLGGALVHADPAGDLGAVAVALDAEFEIVGPGGRRTVPAAEFFVDYFATAVEEDEILSSIRFPSYAGWTARYEKFQRVAQSWSVVSVACAIRTGGAGIAEARIALTNMGATPIRATAVEEALIGPATTEAITAAAAHAADDTYPVDDTSASAEYRQHLARVLTARAVRACVG